VESDGRIRALGPLDREEKALYTFKVLLRCGVSLYGNCSVLVRVDDLNEAPHFGRKRVVVGLDENAALGSEVVQVGAEDGDEGRNGLLTYSLVQNPGGLLGVDPKNGLLTLIKPLHHFLAPTHPGPQTLSFEVEAADGGEPSLTARQTVLVEIKDVNNFTPVFDHSSYETSLLESTPVNTRFFSLHATDQDLGPNARISFAILGGNEGGRFGVFPDGRLFVRSPLDREDQDYFSLSVEVRDGGVPPRASTVTLVIHVIDENDFPPTFSNTTFTFFLSENEGPDAFVGKVSASDGDVGRNAELSFSIPALQNDFMVEPKTGVVKSLRSFDRELLLRSTGQDFVSLEVVVQDGGAVRLRDTATLRILIEDENDNAPLFQREAYSAQISEGAPVGAQVARVLASDLDQGLNGDVVYYFHRNMTEEEDPFRIDASTGQVTLGRALDRETVSEYVLTVVAKDAAESSSLSSSTTLTVQVLDENGKDPFSPTHFYTRELVLLCAWGTKGWNGFRHSAGLMSMQYTTVEGASGKPV
jgi:hypothetical protein